MLDTRGLSDYQVRLLISLTNAFRINTHYFVAQDSDIVTDTFEQAFRGKLLFHHTLIDAAYNKKAFEYGFRDALREAGSVADLVQSSTERGVDVIADRIRFSLKTEASQNISERYITISKLMEARWIRDCRQSREILVTNIQQHVALHFQNYDRLFILRIFRYIQETGRFLQYELVEIPIPMLQSITYLTPQDFDEINYLNATKAKVYYKGKYALTLVIDGSDEKITLRRIDASLCKLHARWLIPIDLIRHYSTL